MFFTRISLFLVSLLLRFCFFPVAVNFFCSGVHVVCFVLAILSACKLVFCPAEDELVQSSAVLLNCRLC